MFSPLIKSIVTALQDKKGEQISVVDFTPFRDAVCDYFVIVNAASAPHRDALLKACADGVFEEHHRHPFAVSGEGSACWVAVDYGEVMVHIFQPEARTFYNLEGLWADAEITNLPDVE